MKINLFWIFILLVIIPGACSDNDIVGENNNLFVGDFNIIDTVYSSRYIDLLNKFGNAYLSEEDVVVISFGTLGVCQSCLKIDNDSLDKIIETIKSDKSVVVFSDDSTAFCKNESVSIEILKTHTLERYGLASVYPKILYYRNKVLVKSSILLR
ncbi:MAG: hypothetical protein DRI86_14030 [Bacteroidetes bacterium]|nr:MAG: hypothetical protein DRI86_14030 [Bacteroidota bacterium]